MTTFQLGETPRITATITDSGGSATDPNTTTITIKSPDRTTVVDAQAMTKAATGSYYYDYTIPSDTGIAGTYKLNVTATGTGGRVTIKTAEFDVEASV